MASESNTLEDQNSDRAQRFVSHALVEVRRFKTLPFFCDSAVLLDISTGGFKLEFTGEVTIIPGNQYWLNIPLSPLGIYAPKRLSCRIECRWFDDSRFRIGGTFTELTKTDQLLIEQIVASLKSRGQL
mgnify:CR=1 FL=1